MPPEEAFAELEKKVERLETALGKLLDALIDNLDIPVDVVIASGDASNVLSGIAG